MSAVSPVSKELKKQLALAIIDFLNTSLTDGTLSAEDRDSIEVATTCISEAFGVDTADQVAMNDAIGGPSLASIYSVYEKVRGHNTPSPGDGSSAQPSMSTVTKATTGTITGDHNDAAKGDEDKYSRSTRAEQLKRQGNAAMQRKEYMAAIDLYTQAVDLDPVNAIYLSNRAAAHSSAGDHAAARHDAELATAADPAYTKAWSRLGLACYALGDTRGSMVAYQQGIRAEGNGGSEAMKRGYETARRRVVKEEEAEAEETDTAITSGQDSGSSGAMPDLSSLAGAVMNNPMLRQMAGNLISNPQLLQSMMNNPRTRDMDPQLGGGTISDFSRMMQDPNIMEMARNLMGGDAGRSAGAKDQ